MSPSSALTRSVFRALLANRPYRFAACPKRVKREHAFPQCKTTTRIQTRSIFGLGFGSNARNLAQAKNTPDNVETALSHLVDLARSRRSQSKTPALEDISDALRFLFRSHLEAPRPFTRNEVFLVTDAVDYMKHVVKEQPDIGNDLLNKDDLQNALQALALGRDREKFRSDTSALARRLFSQLRAADSMHDTKPEDLLPLQTYIDILSATGSALDARDLLLKSPRANDRRIMSIWLSVVKGLYAEARHQDAWAFVQKMNTQIGSLDQNSHTDLVTAVASTNNVQSTQQVYDLNIENGAKPSTQATQRAIELCMQQDSNSTAQSWGQDMVRSLASTKNPAVLDTVLLWELKHGAKGFDLESVLRNSLSSLDASDEMLNMSNFNRVISYAFLQGDAKLAEQCLIATKSRGLSPDAYTYLPQLDYQVKSGDLQGAEVTYELVSAEDLPEDHADIPVLNRFLTKLCFDRSGETELIMRIVDGLLDRDAELEAETLAGLCHVFLQRDEIEEAMGLLRYRADSYPFADRARICAVFQQFITDPNNKDHRAFNAYELMRHAFPETPVAERLQLMWSFFDRNRSDLACLVFGHMRQRDGFPERPDDEAYAQCFEGIAQCRDVDGLQMIYNMLKLDLLVEQTTRIHNALMAAYTACQMPFTSIIDHFWKIMDSREGPTQSSFALALRACETWVPQGSQEARRIIALMQTYGFDIDKEIYHCYLGAIAGNSEFENAVELIEEMYSDLGESPDVTTIGTFYNAIPWQFRKDEVETWAKQAYPELWEELLTYGDEVDEEFEVRWFKIPRDIDMRDEPLFDRGDYNPQIARNSQVLLEQPAG